MNDKIGHLSDHLLEFNHWVKATAAKKGKHDERNKAASGISAWDEQNEKDEIDDEDHEE